MTDSGSTNKVVQRLDACCTDTNCCPPEEALTTFRRTAPKVGRNDPCPCDSGRKFKKCCGQLTSVPQRR